jgi:murein DD-endopeptidase MepM/ murein hydrolase activator NlpD
MMRKTAAGAALATLALAGGCTGTVPASRDHNVIANTEVPGSDPASTYIAARPSAFAFAGELTQGGWIKGTVPAGTYRLALDGKPIALDPDGSFFAAFDRDAPPTAALVATLRQGAPITQTLSISRRAWAIENVNIARRQSGPSEAFMALRRPELARIEAARLRETGAAGWRQDFAWPVKARISGRFGSQRVYRGEPGAYHSGIDLAGGSGTTFVAPADGVVILAADEPFTLEGNLLMIDHGMGLNSAFLHCSEILVREGEHVRQGQPIGRIGASGRATGPHLHWSVKWNDARLDPILLTGPMTR